MSASSDMGPTGRLKRWMADNDVFVVLILFVAGASVASPTFLTAANLSNLLTQSAMLGLLSVAQFLIIVTAGFDLSVAAVMALSSLVFARLVDVSFVPAAIAAILAGGACGLVNGLVITRGRVQPLIATLAMMGIARGLALSISERSILVNNATLAEIKSLDGFLSVPTVIWFVVVAIAWFWFSRSRQALHLYAIGGNETTARLAGVPVDRLRIGAYTVSGLIAGLTGVVLVIRSNSGVPLGGTGWELYTIAAVVIGGTSIFGGEGKLLHAMAGVLIYQMIANVMNLTGVDPYYQDIVRAAVIILAVGLSILRLRQRHRVRAVIRS
ncbi:MAG: ABC transporter permease [Bauldia sp.]|nr:ABC transporter permease [Bauldia sp.]